MFANASLFAQDLDMQEQQIWVLCPWVQVKAVPLIGLVLNLGKDKSGF